MDHIVSVAGILGAVIVVAVSILAVTRLRIEQQRTVQMLIEKGLPGDELLRSLGLVDRRRADLRRGMFLIAVGVAWSTVTFFMGGTAWRAGVAPIAIGAAFLLLRVVDDRPR